MEYIKAMVEDRAPVMPCEEYWSWGLKPVRIDPGRWPDLGPRGGYGESCGGVSVGRILGPWHMKTVV